MALKPWYKVVTPREDLREGKPLDASEFAVHLDQVRDGRAPEDYQKPERFFERTYLTKNLSELGGRGRPSALRRDDGNLRRLQHGDAVRRRQDPRADAALPPGQTTARGKQVGRASTDSAKGAGADVPKAATAVFVGTEFDSITGRGGRDGTPLRKTPWGEIACQLGGEKGLRGRRRTREADDRPGRRRDPAVPARRTNRA